MIHIVTIHFNTPEWVETQVNYIHRHLGRDKKIYSAFTNVEALKYKKYFNFGCNLNITSHAQKLNILADEIIRIADDDDILIFMDSDAFPVSPCIEEVKNRVNKYQLTAITRYENLGDCFPHPSFCATTMGFWKWLKGDWGHEDIEINGRKRRDTGSKLYLQLKNAGIDWHRMKRTGQLWKHPIFFGIYNNEIYHHGAGSRCMSTIWDEKHHSFGRKNILHVSKMIKDNFRKGIIRDINYEQV